MASNFGQLLRNIRLDAAEYMADMARKTDISVSYLSMIENGSRDIPRNLLEKIYSNYDLSDDIKAALQREYDLSKLKPLTDILESIHGLTSSPEERDILMKALGILQRNNA